MAWRASKTEGKSTSPVPNSQVFVDAAAHVVDLDVDEVRGGGGDAGGGWAGLVADEVADVEGEAEGFAAHVGLEFQVAGQVVDEHAWFWFET